VVIPTWNRTDTLLKTLRKLQECDPLPAEILVHVDKGDTTTAPALREHFPQVGILTSDVQVGPGGGRNKLVAAARHEIVASLDDDSFPLDADYFGRLLLLFQRFPSASAIASSIFHREEQLVEDEPFIGATVHFIGCGVAYRRQAYLDAGGYVPLPVAYGMEEVDLALRLHASGHQIYESPWLRVYHDTWLRHHVRPRITAASISNLALLTFLRYPVWMWPYGVLQVFNRVVWLIKARRFRGIAAGLFGIPLHLWKHRQWRSPVGGAQLKSFIALRKSEPQMKRLEEREQPA
jgi:GT2 family glycosyltransferase